jgi:hypothetical protein
VRVDRMECHGGGVELWAWRGGGLTGLHYLFWRPVFDVPCGPHKFLEHTGGSMVFAIGYLSRSVYQNDRHTC